MRKTILIALFILSLTLPNFAQKRLGNETPAQKTKRMEWWTDARFGMFIHWGLYALPARHEWVRNLPEILRSV
jgi:alpha-L-fucosidase